MSEKNCISLIGMPGAGKSTLGKCLAEKLAWAFIDTDHLIESIYARRLQDITDALERNEFLDVEGNVICALEASQCVIATGGSVIYRPKAMAKLQKLGPIVFLNLPLADLEARINLNPERGISFGPGQSLADLYSERLGLYRQYATCEIDTKDSSPEDCAAQILPQMLSLIKQT